MIISASRRTDIPNYYADWFIQRLRETCCMVRNPMYPNNVSKIRLNTSLVDCIVFWSKNPYNIIKYLNEIDEMGYNYYFHFTINGYGQDMEPKVLDKSKLIEIFIELSEKIGKEKVIWRYDPIFGMSSGKYNVNWHINVFELFINKLHKYTEKCIFSLWDQYRKKNKLHLYNFNQEQIEYIFKSFSEINQQFGLKLETCAEEVDLNKYNISKSKCIDGELISKIVGYNIIAKKDKAQRGQCGCMESVDIGEYNTCINNCYYCYANSDLDKTHKKYRLSNPGSTLITGRLKDGDILAEYRKTSCRERN